MYIDRFTKYLRYERNYSSHTVFAYERDLREFGRFFESRMGVSIQWDQVNAAIVREWMVEMMSADLSARYVKRKLSALKSFFRFLIKQGVVAVHPLRWVEAPAFDKKLPIFVMEQDMERFLIGDIYQMDFETCRDRLVVEILYQTGVRRAELIGLDDDDVSVSAQTIRVLGKRNKERIVPFGGPLQQVIDCYLQSRASIERQDHAFLVSSKGCRITAAKVYAITKQALSAMPHLSKRSPHVLRHSFATAMLNNGAGINTIKELMGHASLAATEVYTHTTFEELKKVYHQSHPRD